MKQTKIYAEVLEQSALDQFNEAMSMECAVQGALMPDAHTGYTLPIGAVIKTKGKVFPSFVGYDIGCGMVALKLDIDHNLIDMNKLKEQILKRIPIGFDKHSEPHKSEVSLENTSKILQNAYSTVGVYQLGTLGGGNHFLEVAKGDDDKLWIVIHSGSRGLGHKVAEHYMSEAYLSNVESEQKIQLEEAKEDFIGRNTTFKEKNPEGFVKALEKFMNKHKETLMKKNKNIEGLYGFDVESDIGKQYLIDMDFCLEYALANRKYMVNQVHAAIEDIIGETVGVLDFINRNHNHAEIKEDYVIHRKGATHAEEGMKGVIPGNMRDGSFIVVGKGNAESLCSSSHGAGRVLSRTQAEKTLDLNEFHEQMVGIVTNHTDKNLDEAPKAYKNIFDVMEAQKDLVEVIDRAVPLLNIKG